MSKGSEHELPLHSAEGLRPREALRDSIGLYVGGKRFRFKVRVAKEIAPWITEVRWHPAQKLEALKNGDVVIEKDSDGYLVAWVPALSGCHTQARSHVSTGRVSESSAPIGSNIPGYDNYLCRDCRRIVHVRKGRALHPNSLCMRRRAGLWYSMCRKWDGSMKGFRTYSDCRRRNGRGCFGN